MWFLVNLPGNKLKIAVKSDRNSIAAECLNKVCHDLGIVCETDYFGLLYATSIPSSSLLPNEKQWINLRNPLQRRHSNDRTLMLELRVKFWVPGHLILQESVREIFYMQARQMLLDGEMNANNWENAARLSALLAQADGVKFSPLKVVENETICDKEMPNNFLHMIAREHEKMATMSTSSAKYWLLEEIALLKKFGEEPFEGVLIPTDNPHHRTSNNHHDIIRIGVSPHGLSIHRMDKNDKFNIPFSAVESAKSLRRVFHLTYLNEDQETTHLIVKFSSHRIAGAIYRALTEKHAFYSCETVRSAVTTQFIRDLKGTIISMFNEDTEMGKRYVFDIQRTCREVYDNSRRILHQRGIDVSGKPHYPALDTEQTTSDDKVDKTKTTLDLTCNICMDNEIDTLFSPCGHICCNICAIKCERCPLCRTNVTSLNKVFLPMKVLA
ncbi:unnamed protein product [Diamesa hyperborea]